MGQVVTCPSYNPAASAVRSDPALTLAAQEAPLHTARVLQGLFRVARWLLGVLAETVSRVPARILTGGLLGGAIGAIAWGVDGGLLGAVALAITGGISGLYRGRLGMQLGVLFLAAFVGGVIGSLFETTDGWEVGGAVAGFFLGASGPADRRFGRMYTSTVVGAVVGLFQGAIFYGVAWSSFFGS